MASALIGNLIFSAVGFVAFTYGKRQGEWRPAILGVLLMTYPYFVAGTLALYGIGALLTALVFIWRD